jgi:transcriptional regulator of arginine metabolism
MSARDKAARHRRIVQILKARDVGSQAELAKLLGRGDASVTQATLSRDLEELGAFKARTPEGDVVYRLPDEPPANGAWLERMLREFAIDVEASGNLVVLKTPPGGAGPVARAIDGAGVNGVVGTVAGDDTILIICRQGTSAKTIAGRLRALAGQFSNVREA